MPKEVPKESLAGPRTPKTNLKSPIIKIGSKKRLSLSPKEVTEKIGVSSGLWIQDEALALPTEVPENGVPMVTLAKNRVRGQEIVVCTGIINLR